MSRLLPYPRNLGCESPDGSARASRIRSDECSRHPTRRARSPGVGRAAPSVTAEVRVMSESKGTLTPSQPVEPSQPVDIPAPPALQSVAEPPSTAGDGVVGPHPTARGPVRRARGGPRRGPLTRMGPRAPVAGAAVGLLLGGVVVLLLASTA